MNNRIKSVKNLAFSLLNYVIAIVCGLLLPRLFVVTYGSEVNGLLNSLGQLLVYLGLFEAGIGAVTLQALYGPVAQDDWGAVSGVLSAANRYYRKMGVWYLMGILVISIGYPLLIDTSLSFATVFGASLFNGLGNVVIFFFLRKYQLLLQADGKNYILTNLTTFTTIVTSLAKIILISMKVNVVAILAVSFMLTLLQIGYVTHYMRRSYPHLNRSAVPNTKAMEQKNAALGHQIGSLVFHNTDVLILTVACGLKVVSVYSMFKLITTQLEHILGLLSSSINFLLGQNYQTDRKLYAHRLDLFDSFHSALLYALFSVALFLFLPFMRLYTAGVTDINYIDPWLALLFVLASLLYKSRVPMLMSIDHAGHFRNTLNASILEAAINLTVSLVGVYFLGIYGVLLGTVVALAYRTNDIILYANHRILNRSAKKTYAIYAVNIVLFILTQVLFHHLFAVESITSYPRFILVGLVCVIFALLIQFSGQVLLFSHCRSFLKGLIVRFRHIWKQKKKK